ncbi:MAG: sarcosine oxidase, gamma subunit [Proteobacteria bacterium]|nr:sarcosine oxidase, gamma subunit [Pseudomonadota bacterium]
MADALHFAFNPGRLGHREGAPGLVLQELTQFTLASVIACKDQAAQAAAAAQRAFGTSPPMAPATAAGNALTFIWSGPGHWLALGPHATGAVEARLGTAFGTHASVFDQSGSRVLLELRGPRARDVLAKGMSIDLHPRAFRTGDVAVTTASHLAVHLWQVADEPVYRLLVVRTWFDSLWRWLAASAAEYGCEVLAPAPYASHTA